MQLKDAVSALKTLIAGLEWPGAAGVALFSAVYLTTDPPGSDEPIYPMAVIRKTEGRPHNQHGDKLWFYRLEVEISQDILPDEFGEGQILDQNRDGVVSEGAGLAELETAVIRQTNYIDSGDSANIRPYVRCLGSGAWMTAGEICSVRVEYEALLRIDSD